MGAIRETFTMEDKVTSVMTRVIQVCERMAGSLDDVKNSMLNVETASASTAVRMDRLSGQMQDATDRMDRARGSGTALTGALRGLVSAAAAIKAAKWLTDTSDQMAQTAARLDMMNDGMQTTVELQEMIYQSAQRSRGVYQDTADMVAKLGTLAGGAFDSSAEIVAFAEQINKQMALSGTNAAGRQAAMLQLTQGLSSGVLRGEELNSILEQTPMIAMTIAEYMGVTTGEMRELASQGAVTAEVVKNAMLGAAEETDAAFERLPMTWAQVWTQVQNIAVQALQPLLDVIGQGAQWVGDNLETIIPVVYGLAAAIGILAAAYGVWKVVTLAQAAAQWVLNSALLANPITWIVIAIAAVVGAIVAWINSVGGLEIAWLTAVDAILYWWDSLKAGVMTGVYAVMDLLATMGLRFQLVGTAIANFMGDMKVNVLTILQAMINGAIDLINGFIEKVNLIPGVSIDAIDHVTFATTAAAENEAAKAARNAELAASAQQVAQDIADRQQALQGMRDARDADRAARQQEIADKRAAQASGDSSIAGNVPLYEEIADNTGKTAKSAASIEKSVNMADEDLKNLVDMAERRYVNQINLTAQTPIVTVNGANTGRTQADRQALADTIRDIILEQAASGATRSTARAYSGG